MLGKSFGSSGLSVVIGGSRDRNVPTIGVSASKTAHRRDIPVPLLKFQVLLPHLSRKNQIYQSRQEGYEVPEF